MNEPDRPGLFCAGCWPLIIVGTRPITFLDAGFVMGLLSPLHFETPSRRSFGSALAALLTSVAFGVPLAAPGKALADLVSDANGGAVPAAPLARTWPTPARSEESLAVRGIYLQQSTAQDEARLAELIERSKRAGFDTFVVDLWRPSSRYERAIQTIAAAGLRFVPRITMFPDGAQPGQMQDRALLQRRWRRVDYALKLGAKDIQLDYIRFSSRNQPSPENASRVLEVIASFRQRVHERGGRLQIDVFGEVSYGPSIRIGQDMRLFAPVLDAVCPMLYPSHFEPYREAARTPYQTVHGALAALEGQTQAHPLPIYPFIEHFNYRYRMTEAERAGYFEAQLEAVLNSTAQGFYVWSVGNHYDIPFAVLERRARERRAELRRPADSLATAPTRR